RWWPNQLNLSLLARNGKAAPLLSSEYKEAFKRLDFQALVADLEKLMTDSQDWWPAGEYLSIFESNDRLIFEAIAG
ncbi:hypothetical protein HDU77_000248, partial [Chytriomyces hyalinus]